MKLMKGKITKKLSSVALSLMMVMTFFPTHVVSVYADSTPTGESMDEAGCEKHSGIYHVFITGAHSNSAYVCGIAYKTEGTIFKKTNKLGEGFGRSYFPEGGLGGWYYWDSNTSKFVSCDGHHGKHEAKTDWETNETKHWHACKVEGCTDHIYNEEAHSYGESGAARYTCTVCGYVDHTKQVSANETDAPSGLYMDEAYCTNDTEGTHRQHIYVTDVDGERVICIIVNFLKN